MDSSTLAALISCYASVSMICLVYVYLERPGRFYDSVSERWVFGLFWIFYLLIWLFITAPKTIAFKIREEIKK
jgi:hypothetical protein